MGYYNMPLQSDLSKGYIAEALILLMKRKNFSSITNKEITDKAGVSHITIYRNFSNKEEIVKYYLRNIFNDWNQTRKDNENIACQIFQFFCNHKDIIDLLYKANLQYLLIDNILELNNYKKGEPCVSAYSKVTAAYLIFGWCDEWYKRGMAETPEVMAKLFSQNKTDGLS